MSDVREILENLTEAVGRGDEVGLPEAYRAAVSYLREPDDWVAILAEHQLESHGMTYGSADRCTCGAKTYPEPGPEDIMVRRAWAFAVHQAAVLQKVDSGS